MRTLTRVAALRALWEAVRGQTRPGSPSVPDRLRALPRMVKDTMAGRYSGLQRSRLALMALAVLYVVSPVDLVPEAALMLLGLADDALVTAWLAGAVLAETEAFIAWEESGRPGDASRERTVPGTVL